MATSRIAAPPPFAAPAPLLIGAGAASGIVLLAAGSGDAPWLAGLLATALIATLWALWLAVRAGATAARLARTPRPAPCPQRRGLLLSRYVRRPIMALHPALLLLARFTEQAAAWPAVRVEDKVDRLQRVAVACRAAALGLAVLSAASLLAALAG